MMCPEIFSSDLFLLPIMKNSSHPTPARPKARKARSITVGMTGDLDHQETIPQNLPILPIRNGVLFPGMVLPLSIGRLSSKKLISELPSGNKTIGVFTQCTESDEEPGAGDLYPIGVAAQVLREVKESEENTVIIVNVLERVKLTAATSASTATYLQADVEVLHTTPHADTPEWQATVNTLRDTALRYLSHKQDVPEQVSMLVRNLDDGGKLTDFIAGGLELSTTDKQGILEELNVAKRIRTVQAKVAHQLHIAELQEKIQKDVHEQFSDQQRRAYLQEQMKAIQKELGEGRGEAPDGTTRLREKLAAAAPPAPVMEQAERELKRLDGIPTSSPEAGIITQYVETIANLPWNVSTEDNLDLDRAQKILDQDHFGLEKVKRRLIEHLAVRKLKPDGHSPILLLLGPPGVGKTSLGQSVARALGRKFIRISLGGVHDEADIRGHRRTYIGAMPGRLMEEIRRAGSRNPLILLDEIDKIGRDFRGDPSSALLEVLDPHQNQGFTDHYLDVPFDLSKVLFLATANDLSTIPAPLRDRLEIMELSSYTEREKRGIAQRRLIKRQLSEHGLKGRNCIIQPAAVNKLITSYTREAGVRDLERQIGSLCRAAAAKIVREDANQVVIDPAFVEKALGPVKFEHEIRNETPRPGIVTGLAWTPVGGEILHIEALRYPGTGQIKLTGMLGDVMKESVAAALSLVCSRAEDLHIDPTLFKTNDIHLHVPAGATPKDGPSAGGAMFTALASLFSGRKVRPDLAMTGEISLRGLVLPIGGLKEKTLAALRAGIHTVIAPKANQKDLTELPAEVTSKTKFIWVENADQVLNAALVAEPKTRKPAKRRK